MDHVTWTISQASYDMSILANDCKANDCEAGVVGIYGSIMVLSTDVNHCKGFKLLEVY